MDDIIKTEVKLSDESAHKIVVSKTEKSLLCVPEINKIEMIIECPSCKGTGIYSGVSAGDGAAFVCNKCKGTGAYEYKFSYKPFIGRKKKDGIKRVFLTGMGYKIGLGKVNLDGIGEINMDKEGVYYSEFLEGKKPTCIKKLGCPMAADQGACHNIKGFTYECDNLNGGYIDYISKCKYRHNKDKC